MLQLIYDGIMLQSLGPLFPLPGAAPLDASVSCNPGAVSLLRLSAPVLCRFLYYITILYYYILLWLFWSGLDWGQEEDSIVLPTAFRQKAPEDCVPLTTRKKQEQRKQHLCQVLSIFINSSCSRLARLPNQANTLVAILLTLMRVRSGPGQ